MQYVDFLEIVASWASIITALVAVVAYGNFVCYRRSQVKAVEKYLASEKALENDKGQRSVTHLMARLKMTEAEVLGAAFRSKRIRSVVGTGDNGRADDIMFQYMNLEVTPTHS